MPFKSSRMRYERHTLARRTRTLVQFKTHDMQQINGNGHPKNIIAFWQIASENHIEKQYIIIGLIRQANHEEQPTHDTKIAKTRITANSQLPRVF